MAFKVTTIIIAAILWISFRPVIPTAFTTASGHEIDEAKMKELLQQKENFEKLVEVFKENMQNGVTQAKEKLKSYAKSDVCIELRNLLELAIDSPKLIYDAVAPTVKEMHERYERENRAYRTFLSPLWSFATNVGCIAARTLGFSAWTLGQLIQTFNDVAKEGMINYNDGKPLQGKAKNIYDQIHIIGELGKVGGNLLETQAKLRLARKAQNGVDNTDPNSKLRAGKAE